MQSGLGQLRQAGGRLASGELWQQAGQRWRLAAAAAADRWTDLRQFVSEFDAREFMETTRLLVLTEGESECLPAADGVRCRTGTGGRAEGNAAPVRNCRMVLGLGGIVTDKYCCHGDWCE